MLAFVIFAKEKTQLNLQMEHAIMLTTNHAFFVFFIFAIIQEPKYECS